ncbi:menin [Uranotaenia lowii]|uniref:menin n=1 Tax=Uranotaenia lowii TaxID=190385 RepID=UPI0024786607|nr:menin [Uranotaenia lowii]
MTEFGDEVIRLFPLRTIPDVIRLFRQQLNNRDEEPDLTLLSIVTGLIEHSLTTKVLESSAAGSGSGSGTSQQKHGPDSQQPHIEVISNFPVIKYDVIEGLYKKFKMVLSPIEKLLVKNTMDSKFASREIIKKVSDIIWNSLLRSSYKDRAHLQSLYSYLCGSKLDCFGVAFAVVAGCQMLGYRDVHLAISEDHVWVVFGKTGEETIEVTWHGKGAEDKRGQSVAPGVESQTWLYVAGNPVVCSRYMEVAAIVSAINPSLTATSACLEVADLQQQLLWQLYDMGHLKKYPMALGCLGELEEVSPTPGRKSCEDLYNESVRSAQVHYRNHHVYPYTYQGGFYYRKNMYREAFASWADSSDVIRLYNYSRDDEEIYKEFLDIANELIPQVMKLESSGHSARSILRDSHCFANLLRFYDGICMWEEGSLTPILHIGWAKPLVATIAKFDHDIRSQVIIKCGEQSPRSLVCRINGGHDSMNNNNNIVNKVDANLESVKKEDKDSTLPKSLEALVGKCGEKLLNPDFLLQGGGQPFTSEDGDQVTTTEINGPVKNGKKEKSCKKEENSKVKVEPKKESLELVDSEDGGPKRPMITLYSQKMKGLKDLLLTEKLNTNAISLQITAQSQVQVGGKKSRNAGSNGPAGTGLVSGENEANTRSKRARRE